MRLGTKTPAERALWAERVAFYDRERLMTHYRDNEVLLADLVARLGAERPSDEIGAAFFKTPVDWRCPVCLRTKWEFAKLNRHGLLHCRIVSHHDHFPDYVYWEKLCGVVGEPSREAPERDAWEKMRTALNALQRFGATDICDDCNGADPRGKKAADAPGYFSFAPHEMAAFVIPKHGAGVDVDKGKARETYETIRPALKIVSDRAAVIVRSAMTCAASREQGN